MNYRYLFRPLWIGGMELKNRIAMPAINHSYSEDGHVNERLISYYAARSRGGAGLIVITSYSIHYTKLYEAVARRHGAASVGWPYC